jgi:hypothetical protein
MVNMVGCHRHAGGCKSVWGLIAPFARSTIGPHPANPLNVLLPIQTNPLCMFFDQLFGFIDPTCELFDYWYAPFYWSINCDIKFLSFDTNHKIYHWK